MSPRSACIVVKRGASALILAAWATQAGAENCDPRGPLAPWFIAESRQPLASELLAGRAFVRLDQSKLDALVPDHALDAREVLESRARAAEESAQRLEHASLSSAYSVNDHARWRRSAQAEREYAHYLRTSAHFHPYLIRAAAAGHICLRMSGSTLAVVYGYLGSGKPAMAEYVFVTFVDGDVSAVSVVDGAGAE